VTEQPASGTVAGDIGARGLDAQTGPPDGHEGHHGRPASWVAVTVIIIGFVIGGIALTVGPILAADAFYTDRPDLYDRLADYGVLAVEMESAATYTIAARHRARNCSSRMSMVETARPARRPPSSARSAGCRATARR